MSTDTVNQETPATVRPYDVVINGERRAAKSTFPVFNPSTGKAIGEVPDVDTGMIRDSLQAAEQGFATWSGMSHEQRRPIILRYAELIEENSERLIQLLMDETGKPRDNAEYDFGMLVTCLRFFVEEAERLDQPVLHDPSGRFLHYIQRQSLGVVVGFLAWNFPLLNIGYKLGPVLASGCSAIIKPAKETPLASLEVAYLAKEAGIPDGVVNVITSADHDVVAELVQSDIPALVTMIGSTRGGLEVMNSSLTTVKHFSVELGGNAPAVVYDDADVETAANKIVDLKYTNTGQVCVSVNRCYVHEKIYDQFIECAKKRTASVKMGPVINEKERDRVVALVGKAVEQGAKLECGGHAIDGPGYFMEPTVLSDVQRDMTVSCEELFGPVLSIMKFTDDDDEIALANDTEYGLAAYVFTSNLSRALCAARDIQAGSVCVNEPHYSIQLPHGGLKQSGVGKDCSRYSLEEYLTVKRVSVLVEPK